MSIEFGIVFMLMCAFICVYKPVSTDTPVTALIDTLDEREGDTPVPADYQ